MNATSPKGVAFIAQAEGVVTKAYRDAVGVWTIGVGHTASAGGLKPKSGMTITRQQALDLLATDLAKFEKRVTKRLGDVRQNVFDGAVSFDFNTGAINTASWPALYIGGKFDNSRASFMQWVKAGGKTLPGLVKRRTAEAKIIFDDVYPDGLVAPAIDRDEYVAKIKSLGYADVEAFQKAKGLVVDDIIGPATAATVDRAIAASKAKTGITVAATMAGALTGGTADAGFDAHTVLTVGGAVGAIVAVAAVAAVAWHYRGVIVNAIKKVIPHA